MSVFWLVYQKEHLELAMLFDLSGASPDDFLLMGVISTYFLGIFRGRVLCGLYFPYEASFYCRSIVSHFGRAFCRRLNLDVGQLVFNPPVDLVPFTLWICVPTTTSEVLVSRFQTSGVLSILSGDAPWTCDSEGHPRIKLFVLAQEHLFPLMNLWYHATRGTNFISGVSMRTLGQIFRLKLLEQEVLGLPFESCNQRST